MIKREHSKKIFGVSYRGKGNDELEYDVFPQPYLGDVKNHSVITLNLNPSRSKKNKENILFEETHLPKFNDAIYQNFIYDWTFLHGN